MEQDLIKYKDAEKILNDSGFFARLVGGKRGIKLTHTFWSVRWYAIEFKVTTIKVEGTWIVIGVTMNGKELEGWEKLLLSLENIHKLQNQFRQTLFKKVS